MALVKVSQLESLILQTADVSMQDYSFAEMDYRSFLMPSRRIQERKITQREVMMFFVQQHWSNTTMST